jgi:hypothetical protein
MPRSLESLNGRFSERLVSLVAVEPARQSDDTSAVTFKDLDALTLASELMTNARRETGGTTDVQGVPAQVTAFSSRDERNQGMLSKFPSRPLPGWCSSATSMRADSAQPCDARLN